jgi:hypothetical protein
VQVGPELARLVKSPLANALPRLFVDDLGVEFELPNDLEWLSLRVVVEACQCDLSSASGSWLSDNRIHQVRAASNPHDLTGLRPTYTARRHRLGTRGLDHHMNFSDGRYQPR